jgi:membrane fusion protein, macrolide-specific efflux system
MNTFPFPTAAALAAMLLLWPSAPGTAAPPDPSASSLTVRRGDLRLFVRAAGAISWSNPISVRTPMAGRIDQVRIHEGQPIRKGDCAAMISSPQRAVLMDVARNHGQEDLEKWEKVYQPIPVLSPADGTVIKVSALEGQNIGPEQMLFTVGDVLVARAYVEETEIPWIAPGGIATLAIDALPGAALTGTVVRVGTQSTPYRNAVAYEVDLAVEAWPEASKPGMSLSALFAGPHRENVLKVPCTAVIARAGEARVCLVAPDGTISFQVVHPGLNDGVEVEILDGLQDGARVLTDALLGPANGAAGNPRYSPLLPFTRGR